MLNDQRRDLETREEAAERLQEESRERMRLLITALLLGGLALLSWRMVMREEIRRLHFALAVIAGADLDTDPELRRRIMVEVDAQLRYLERWVMQLAGQPRTAGQEAALVYRAGLYATAALHTFFLAYTRGQGLPFLPFYPKQKCLCHVGCKCRWLIVPLRGRGNWNCYWLLGAAEHCATCVARSRAANPLKVRNGLIIDPQRYQAANLYA